LKITFSEKGSIADFKMQYNNALITITKDATADPYILYHHNKFYLVKNPSILFPALQAP